MVTYLITAPAFVQWLVHSGEALNDYVIAWYTQAPYLVITDMDEFWCSMARSPLGGPSARLVTQVGEGGSPPARKDVQAAIERSAEQSGPTSYGSTIQEPVDRPDKPRKAQDVLPMPVTRLAAQQAAILAEIRNQGYDPLALPMYRPSQPGVKARVRDALVGVNPLFQKRGTQFKHAWEGLAQDKGIRYRKD